MNVSRFRLAFCASLCAALLGLAGCANFPANEPSALPPPHNGKAEAP
jgi:hypothetical protein